MKKLYLIILPFLLLSNICAQEIFFLDSLFLIDVSGINKSQYALQRAEIKRLRHDIGLTTGVNITNSFQDEIGAGLSTRIYAKTNLMSGGYSDNLNSSEIIEYQILIDSIGGIDRAIDHNYGIFFDYVIYQYNKEKSLIIDSILVEGEFLNNYYNSLYHNKLIGIEDVISIESTINQYSMLRKSQQSYNSIFEKVLAEIELPLIPTNAEWNVDFNAISEYLEHDSTHMELLFLKKEILNLNLSRDNTPALSLAAGYDISRHRPYFGVNFNVNIKPQKRQHIEAKSVELENNARLEKIQKKKELINLQYEFQYKEKQIAGLYTKLELLDEELRKYKVKGEVLSLNDDILCKRNKLNRLLIKYEIIDLIQQQMLLLLKVKKTVNNLHLGDFISRKGKIKKFRKYKGNRYVNSLEEVNSFDKLFLTHNEISITSPEKLIDRDNIEFVDPDKFDNRYDFEMYIEELYLIDPNTFFLIESIDKLKSLELRTLAQQNYDITAINYK